MRYALRITVALSMALSPLFLFARTEGRSPAEELIPRLQEDELERGCQVWNGLSVGGNDHTVELRIRLCPDGDGGYVGRTIWHSPRSGYSLRAIRGTFDEAARVFTLTDTDLLEEKPNPGWRFCKVDLYTITLEDDDTISGVYDSAECTDHAQFTLTLEQ